MTQLGLLEWTPPRAVPQASEQARHLARVEGRIAALVIEFCAGRVGEEFHLSDLTGFVSSRAQVAPDSPRRILGQLRRAGVVDVELLDRGGSLYRVQGVWDANI